jgi:hypothetical protein
MMRTYGIIGWVMACLLLQAGCHHCCRKPLSGRSTTTVTPAPGGFLGAPVVPGSSGTIPPPGLPTSPPPEIPDSRGSFRFEPSSPPPAVMPRSLPPATSSPTPSTSGGPQWLWPDPLPSDGSSSGFGPPPASSPPPPTIRLAEPIRPEPPRPSTSASPPRLPAGTDRPPESEPRPRPSTVPGTTPSGPNVTSYPAFGDPRQPGVSHPYSLGCGCIGVSAV